MQKKVFKDKVPAFTYMEVLVSLVVISMVAGLLSFSYATGVKSLRNSKKEVTNQILRLNTDTQIRKYVEKVIMPFWENEYEITYSSNQISLPWVNGKEAPISINFPNNVKIVNCEVLLSSSDNPQGLIVTYNIDKEDYITKVLFASYKYGEKEC